MSISQQELDTIVGPMFDEFDANKNGFLEEKEITQLVGRVCETLKIPLPSNEEILARFDKNNDNKLSRNEFKDLVMELSKQANPSS
jgi:Ca2+-binding EF-hand superfamily protein